MRVRGREHAAGEKPPSQQTEHEQERDHDCCGRPAGRRRWLWRRHPGSRRGPAAARAAVTHAARAGTASGLNDVLLAAAAVAALGAIAGFAFGPEPARQPPPIPAPGELSAQSTPLPQDA
jgi:hypothetical protein